MDTVKYSSLEELLRLSDHEILGVQFRFADVIRKFEALPWNDAQKKASSLIKTNTALDYLGYVRRTIGDDTQEPVPFTPPNSDSPASEKQVLSKADKPSVFSENYKLLTRLAPELEKSGMDYLPHQQLSGSSLENVYGSVRLVFEDRDKHGCYLLLEINETSKPTVRLNLYFNTAEKTVLVLSHEGSNGKLEVYDNPRNREMVKPFQEKSQNDYLEKVIKKLLKQQILIQSFELIEDTEEKVEETPLISAAPNMRMIRERYSLMEEEDEDQEEEENENYLTLGKHNMELEAENKSLKEEALSMLFDRNLKAFRLLVPKLTEAIEKETCTIVLSHPEYIDFPVFEIDIEDMSKYIEGQEVYFRVFEIENDTRQELVEFEIFNNQLWFIYNPSSFMGLPALDSPGYFDRYSADTVKTNTALFHWLIMLKYNNYQSTIKDGVLDMQKVEGVEVMEAQPAETPDDGTGVVLGVLGLIGLGILGFNVFKR